MILRDPVHGLISFEGEVDAIVERLLDTREVQRLRRIRALGHASLAFPGAEHSRFAHAVGSAYVMKRYLERVRALASDIPAPDRIDDDMARVALAAALLHDLGHGPYSHAFEAVVPGSRPHEAWTSSILLDPDTEIHRALAEIDARMPEQVERLIHGHSPIPHLARAVSGTFDVDRCDYLMRDSHMTGVRYGLLDLDWLMQSLRLHRGDGETAARLAVDGEKGLTAVEGFFLARLYMYRQVYLHKAVRASEAVLRAMFRRVVEVGAPPGTPSVLDAMIRGQAVSTGGYLELDDHALEVAIESWTRAGDDVLRGLAEQLRTRRLFKTMRLRADVAVDEARARLQDVMERQEVAPEYLGTIDRVELSAYHEDDGMMVLSGGRARRLLEASPLLHGLSRETFVHYRAIFPGRIRQAVVEALADLR